MLTLAGSIFAVFIILYFVGFFFVMAKSRRPSDSAIGEPRVDGCEYVLYGATLIDEGFRYYPDWCSQMLREFDVSIESDLEYYFQTAETVAKHPRDKWAILAREILIADRTTSDHE
jgi:hypothetical protein